MSKAIHRPGIVDKTVPWTRRQEAGLSSPRETGHKEVMIRDGAIREQPMVQLRVSEEYRQEERDHRALEETTVQTNDSTEAVVTH